MYSNIGGPEVLIILIFTFVVAPLILFGIIMWPPKTPNKGTLLAVFVGPLAYIYVDKWGKALLLYFLGWVTGGLLHFIIWPYSIFNIRTEVRRFHDDESIRAAQVSQAKAAMSQDDDVDNDES